MIETEQMQQGCMIIEMCDGILDRAESQFIGLAVDVPCFDAATGEPHAEAIRIVIASDRLLRLDDWQATHFAAPVDQGCVQQTA